MKRLFLALAATFVAVSVQAQSKSAFAALMGSIPSEFCTITYNDLKQDPASVSQAKREKYARECTDGSLESKRTLARLMKTPPHAETGALSLSQNEAGQVLGMCMRIGRNSPPPICMDQRLVQAASR